MILLCLLRLTFVKKKKKKNDIFRFCYFFSPAGLIITGWNSYGLFSPLFLCLQFRQTSAFNGAALITVSVAAVSLIDAGIRQNTKKSPTETGQKE